MVAVGKAATDNLICAIIAWHTTFTTSYTVDLARENLQQIIGM